MTSTSGPLLAGAYTVTIDTHTSLRRSPKAVEVLPRFVHRLIFDALSNIVVERDVIYERTDDVENEPIAYAKVVRSAILNYRIIGAK